MAGHSGSGKTTLCTAARERLGIEFSVSATTRPKRETEEGVYRFISLYGSGAPRLEHVRVAPCTGTLWVKVLGKGITSRPMPDEDPGPYPLTSHPVMIVQDDRFIGSPHGLNKDRLWQLLDREVELWLHEEEA